MSDRENEWRDAISRYQSAPDPIARGEAAGVMAILYQHDWRHSSCPREFLDSLRAETYRCVRRNRLGLHPRDIDRFVDEVLSHLFSAGENSSEPRLCGFSQEPNQFANWLWQVVRNLRWDELRRVSTRENKEKHVATKNAEHGETKLPSEQDFDSRDFLTSPFSERDVFRIQRWDARDCIVLLTLSTATLSDGTTVIIWFKLSESIREKILRRYEIEYKKVVAKPFPPDGLLSAHDHQSRLIALAEALREKVGAVDAIWRRKRRGKLSELDWLKTAELEGTAFLAQGVSSYPAITRTCRKGNGSANDDRSV